jgi:hypothetical protein
MKVSLHRQPGGTTISTIDKEDGSPLIRLWLHEYDRVEYDVVVDLTGEHLGTPHEWMKAQGTEFFVEYLEALFNWKEMPSLVSETDRQLEDLMVRQYRDINCRKDPDHISTFDEKCAEYFADRTPKEIRSVLMEWAEESRHDWSLNEADLRQ